MRTNDHSMAASLGAVLFGAYRRQLLSLVLLKADESFYVREIARLTGVPAGSLHRELKLLTDAGLLLRTTAGNQVRYQANRMCPIFEELAGIFRKTAGLADVLRAALLSLQDRINCAFVFGSVAQGKETVDSDVDVMVVGDVSFSEVVGALSATQSQLQREVNPVVMTSESFTSKRDKQDRFVTRVLKEQRILLMGAIE